MRFEEKLIQLRKANALTQEQLAEKLNVSRQAVSRWESGESAPDMYNLSAICRCFGVSSDYLINDDFTSDEDIPIAQKKNDEIKSVRKEHKILHLISAICFLFAALCSVLGIVTSTNEHQLAASCLSCALTAGLSVAQFYFYFKK